MLLKWLALVSVVMAIPIQTEDNSASLTRAEKMTTLLDLFIAATNKCDECTTVNGNAAITDLASYLTTQSAVIGKLDTPNLTDVDSYSAFLDLVTGFCPLVTKVGDACSSCLAEQSAALSPPIDAFAVPLEELVAECGSNPAPSVDKVSLVFRATKQSVKSFLTNATGSKSPEQQPSDATKSLATSKFIKLISHVQNCTKQCIRDTQPNQDAQQQAYQALKATSDDPEEAVESLAKLFKISCAGIKTVTDECTDCVEASGGTQADLFRVRGVLLACNEDRGDIAAQFVLDLGEDTHTVFGETVIGGSSLVATTKEKRSGGDGTYSSLSAKKALTGID